MLLLHVFPQDICFPHEQCLTNLTFDVSCHGYKGGYINGSYTIIMEVASMTPQGVITEINVFTSVTFKSTTIVPGFSGTYNWNVL